jgi:molecular chaperone GrpE
MPDQNEPEINGAENAAPVDLQATRIAALEAEIADAKDKMMRALAEAENARRRAVKDREDAGKYAVTSFARDLLDFSDNFHRALAAIPGDLHTDERIAGIITGLEAMDANLLKTFEKHGIKKIDPLDEPFNPNFHEVMFEAPVPGKPAGVVIQVIESGYVIADRLLRAAKVGVSKGDGSSHQVDQSA